MNKQNDYNQIAYDFAVSYGIVDYEIFNNIMIYTEQSPIYIYDSVQIIDELVQRNLDNGNEIRI